MWILLSVHHELERNAGAPGATLDLRDALVARGHGVTLASWDDLPPRLAPQAKSFAFPAYVARLARRLARSRRLDIVDASTADAWLWASLPARDRCSGLITRSHGLEHVAAASRRAAAARGELRLSWRYDIYWGGLYLKQVERSLRQADHCLFLNRFDRNHAIDRLGVPPDRAGLHRHGIPGYLLGLPAPAPDRGAIRIAQIGRYSALKGAPISVRLLHRVLRRHPQLEVDFLGVGIPEETVLADFDADLHGRVRAVRSYRREDLPGLLAGHQIMLFPTLTEGFGIALLEAMACGLAPVSSDAPGPSEIIDDGRNGLLAPVGDEGALEAQLERLLADAELRRRIQSAAHATAQAWSWSRSADDAISLYERVLRSAGSDMKGWRAGSGPRRVTPQGSRPADRRRYARPA